MTQPTFEPITQAQRVRPSRTLHVPDYWTAHRPADLKPNSLGQEARGYIYRGHAGPDQGYALKLVHDMLSSDIILKDGESEEDVAAGLAAIATARASSVGRAPVRADISYAASLFNYDQQVPSTQVLEKRKEAFSSAAHDYKARRRLVASVIS
jgi:hypothetical protein